MASVVRAVEVLADPAAVWRAAAAAIAAAALETLRQQPHCRIALTGGSSARNTYPLLRSGPLAERTVAERLEFFWGDERFVPHDHPDSNYRLARAAFLDALPIPPSNIHPFPTELPDPAQAAERYEAELRAIFQPPPASLTIRPGDAGGSHAARAAGDPPPPVLDLTLLGVGDDGHIAALFPGDPALEETVRWAAAVPGSPRRSPPHARLTLTLPVFNASRRILIFSAGASKARALAPLLQDQERSDRGVRGGGGSESRPEPPRLQSSGQRAAGRHPLPVERIQPHSGRLQILVDAAAAGRAA
jgi:6-phosphogluconolactonase